MALPLPLHGVRVLDLGMFWAGPYAGRLLADMGAEVIKVEGPRRPDPLRVVPRGLFPDGEPGAQPCNRSGMINERNRNKLGIALDLVHPRGKALFKELVAISDVVLENFSARVMPKLGLDYPVLREVNPRLVMVSIASQGLTGPERDYVSVDPILQALSGLASLTGPREKHRKSLPCSPTPWPRYWRLVARWRACWHVNRPDGGYTSTARSARCSLPSWDRP
jgi:crotonobetainyl-CoA:carnitine CoA-transferase CaiB-like acyl-CoA transferase